MTTKKIPQRKCTGCQQMKDKKDLVRIVKSKDNAFELDFDGKKNGRGAYICKNTQCLEKAQKSRGLERSFRGPVPREIYENLMKSLETEVEIG